MQIDHPTAVALTFFALNGEMPELEREEVHAHIQVCEHCREQVQSLAERADHLKQLPAAE